MVSIPRSSVYQLTARCFQQAASATILLHSSCLMAVGLSVETWPPIGWHHPFMIGWSKYRLVLLQSQWILGSVGIFTYQKPFTTTFLRSPATALPICLPLGLCKETVKESTSSTDHHWTVFRSPWWAIIIQLLCGKTLNITSQGLTNSFMASPDKYNGNVTLVTTIGTTIPVPYLSVKSLQLIWRSGTRWFHQRVPDLEMRCS